MSLLFSMMLQMQSKLKETFSRFRGVKKFLVHYSFWVNFIAQSLLYVVHPSRASLMFFCVFSDCVGWSVAGQSARCFTIVPSLPAGCVCGCPRPCTICYLWYTESFLFLHPLPLTLPLPTRHDTHAII